MAKTKTTTHTFYVVDLVRNKPKTEFIVIPSYRVDIDIEVTTKGVLSAPDVPSSAMKRLEDAARTVLDKYETVITKEAGDLDAKVGRLMADPSEESKAEADKLVQGVNQSIKNALDSAEGAAKQAVDERLKAEAQGDKNLVEAQVRTALKVASAAISLTTAVGRLVATAGAEVTAYVSIAKTIVTLGLEINQQLKEEDKLRADLEKGIQAYITLRGTTLKQAAERQKVDLSGIDIKHPLTAVSKIAEKVKAGGKEMLKGRDAKGVATEVMDFVVKGIKSKISDAETARIHYRNHTVKTRHAVDALSLEADKLMKAARASKTLKEGVKIGAECMTLKHSVSAMAVTLAEREKFLDEMQELMKGNGMAVDDRTTIDKLKELDKMTIASSAATVASNIKAIYTLVTTLA